MTLSKEAIEKNKIFSREYYRNNRYKVNRQKAIKRIADGMKVSQAIRNYYEITD